MRIIKIPQPDYSDPLMRILSAPLLAHARRCGATLTPEQESVAKEDCTEVREFRAEQYAARVRGGQ